MITAGLSMTCCGQFTSLLTAHQRILGTEVHRTQAVSQSVSQCHAAHFHTEKAKTSFCLSKIFKLKGGLSPAVFVSVVCMG